MRINFRIILIGNGIQAEHSSDIMQLHISEMFDTLNALIDDAGESAE